MKRILKLTSLFMALSSINFAYGNFTIVITGDEKSYSIVDYRDEVRFSEWVFNTENNCNVNKERNDVYYDKQFDQIETCDHIYNRTKSTVRIYSDGQEFVLSNEDETKIEEYEKSPISLTGLHLESSCKNALSFDNTLITQRYTIAVPNQGNIVVSCDMDTDGGGWTVFQYRTSFYDFYRNWIDYENGFGISTNFWLGNKYIHELTKNNTELYVEMTHGNGSVGVARYSNFSISGASDEYRLNVSGFSGNIGDSLTTHSGYKFSTKDNDNDTTSSNCSISYKGAWWYSACHSSNLNGYYHNGSHSSYADGMNWYHWTGHYYSLPKTKMMIR